MTEKNWSEIREKILKEHGSIQLTASGLSMYPFLLVGDSLQLQRVEFNSIKKGDVIAFKRNKNWVLHRVMHISKDYILTKGDSKFSYDEKVTAKTFVGKLTKVTRKEKTIDYSQPISSFRFWLITNRLSTAIFWFLKLIVRVQKKIMALINPS